MSCWAGVVRLHCRPRRTKPGLFFPGDLADRITILAAGRRRDLIELFERDPAILSDRQFDLVFEVADSPLADRAIGFGENFYVLVVVLNYAELPDLNLVIE